LVFNGYTGAVLYAFRAAMIGQQEADIYDDNKMATSGDFAGVFDDAGSL
jgi:hypothetical protein